jgi:hypothetical protein
MFKMKKALAIPLILMILFSGITVKFSVHLCSGNIVATKFSLKGDIASCGMESPGPSRSGVDLFRTHCCDNLIASFQLKTNYVASSALSIETISFSDNFSFVPYIIPDTPEFCIRQTSSNTGPPGLISSGLPSPVSLHKLRI